MPEEYKCVKCGMMVPESNAVFDYMDNATCLDCDCEYEEEYHLEDEE